MYKGTFGVPWSLNFLTGYTCFYLYNVNGQGLVVVSTIYLVEEISKTLVVGHFLTGEDEEFIISFH